MSFPGLTDDQLRDKAPSIFATAGAPSVSDRYAYLPSYNVVRDLRNMGLKAVAAEEGKKKQPDGRQYAMHRIHFQRQNEVSRAPELGDIIPEIQLLNSHDRTSPLAFNVGMKRLVCSNGMTVDDGAAGLSFKVRHTGKGRLDEVHAGMAKIMENLDSVLGVASDWAKLMLSVPQVETFAKRALEIKGTALDVNLDSILRPRNFLDRPNNLWAVFNRLQENITRGGAQGRTATGKNASLKAISTLAADADFNRKLWKAASELAVEVTPASISLSKVA